MSLFCFSVKNFSSFHNLFQNISIQWHQRKTYKLNFTAFYTFIFIQRTWRVDYLTTKEWNLYCQVTQLYTDKQNNLIVAYI